MSTTSSFTLAALDGDKSWLDALNAFVANPKDADATNVVLLQVRGARPSERARTSARSRSTARSTPRLDANGRSQI